MSLLITSHQPAFTHHEGIGICGRQVSRHRTNGVQRSMDEGEERGRRPRRIGRAMSPNKQTAMGIGGCVLAPGGSLYRLKTGTSTYDVAVTVSLLRAEPSLRRLSEARHIACDQATALGYRLVRSYDDAIVHGLV